MSTSYLEHNNAQGARMLNVHDASTCIGQVCSIHNRSHHSMRAFPQIWRNDRALMERRCPHGVGHPDPDHLHFLATKLDPVALLNEAVHGCCGCCAGAYE